VVAVPPEIFAYRRENGTFGVRNHVLILPLDDLSNTAAEGVAKLIPGTLAIPHAYGRLQFGEDLDLFFRTLIGTGANPNVSASVVIGIEPNWTQRVVDGIAKAGKPVAMFSIEGAGDLRTIERASRTAMGFLQRASEQRREPVDFTKAIVSMKCGESDTTTGLASCPAMGQFAERHTAAGGTVLFGETSELTGGEHIVAGRMATPALRDRFMQLFNDYVGFIESQGVDLLGSQPTQGNLAGGLTTIEEKALGNIQKIGNCQVLGVLEPAVAPAGPGLHFMDTSSAAAEHITLMAAAGAVIHLFATGQGNIIGNPIVPVIKISGNPHTVETMSEHIDIDVTGLLRREITLKQVGDLVMESVAKTANGRLTAAELLGHREFVLTKLYRSA
jgi:(2R)-sulfolactate sulfo-lyase subunit beta